MNDLAGADAGAVRNAEQAEGAKREQPGDYGGKLAPAERMLPGLARRSMESSERQPSADDVREPVPGGRESRGGLFGPLGGLSPRGARWYTTDSVKLGDRSSSRPSDPNLRDFALGQLDRLQPGLGAVVRARQDRLYGTPDAPVGAEERRARLTADLRSFLSRYPIPDQLRTSVTRPHDERNR